MRFLLTISLLSLCLCLHGQGTFNSNAPGAWTAAGSWTLVSGTDADGIPDSDDTVVILSTHGITIGATTEACSSLTIQASGTLTVNSGSSVLNVTNAITLSSSTAALNLTASGAEINASDMTLSAGTVSLSNGTLNLTSGTGGLTMSGGTFTLTGTSSLAVTESISMTGGTLRPNAVGVTVSTGDTLQVSTGGTLDLDNGTINVGTDLTIDGGTFTMDRVVAAGTCQVNSETLTHSAGSSTLSGGLIVLSAASGNSLAISGGTFRMQDAMTINVDADALVSGGTWEFRAVGSDAPVYNTGGDITVSSGSFDMDAGNANLGTTSDLIVSGGTFSIDRASGSDPETYIGGGRNITINGGTAEMLRLSECVFSGDLTIAASQSLTLSNNLTEVNAIISGTLNITGADGLKVFNDVTVNSGGTWNVTTTETFSITGDITNNGTWTGCSTTSCDYQLGVAFPTTNAATISGTGAMTSMGNISIFNENQTYTNTNTGGIVVTNNLTGDGTFVNGTNGRLEYSGSGNFTIAGFDASATGNTMVFSGSSGQSLRTTLDADNNYYNLVIDKALDDLEPLGAIRIDNNLTLTSGKLTVLDFDLRLSSGATITGGSSGSYIQLDETGVIRREFSSSDSFTYPIGTVGNYLPFTLDMTSATYGSGSYIELGMTVGAHPNRNSGNTGSGGDDTGTTAVDTLGVYYTLTPNNITSPVYDATYQYEDAHVNGTEANMVPALYRLHPEPSVNTNDWFVSGTVDPTTNTVSFVRADAFGDLYAMDQTLERLPVELVTFQAEAVHYQVQLYWETATEENNAGFQLERGRSPADFQPIALITGRGNSADLVPYRYTDPSPIWGRSFYRLKQLDFNGAFEYSEIISVYVEAPAALKVYPNPVERGQEITIELPNNPPSGTMSRVSLTNQAGVKSFQSQPITHSHSIALPISLQLSPGLYYLELSGDGETNYRKPILIR